MGTEKCPFCGQEIDTAAKRCFFCGAELNEESVHNRLEQLHVQDIQAARRIHKPLLIKVIVVVIFIGVVFFYGTSGRKHTSGVNTGQSLTVKLNAKVAFSGARFVVSNKDSFDWKNVRMEIVPDSVEERFILSVSTILSGETYTAEATKFIRSDGIQFNPDKTKSGDFRIFCDTTIGGSGSYLTDW
jgi:hypothetical protein